MKSPLALMRQRSLLPAVLLALVVLAGGILLRQEPPPTSQTDARIAWYRERLGGRGTYPHYARLGLAYLQKARETGRPQWYAEAERSLRTSLDYQRNFEALYGVGAVLAARHNFSEAQVYADEAAAASPENLEAQGLQFEIALGLGNTENAGATLARMAAGAPDAFEVRTREAALLEYRGALSEALRATETACRDAQRRDLPAGQRAWCAVRRGALQLAAQCDASGAEQAYKQALRTLPGYYFAREHLAELRAAQGNLSRAMELYEELLRDLPVPAYRVALADLYQAQLRDADAQRERAAAQRELEQSVAGGSREHVRELVLLLAGHKEHAAEALRLAESEWQNRRDWLTADVLAWAYYHNGRTREAAEMAAPAIASGNQSAALSLRTAEIFLHAERWGEARDLLSRLRGCPAAMSPAEKLAAESLELRLRRTPRIP